MEIPETDGHVRFVHNAYLFFSFLCAIFLLRFLNIWLASRRASDPVRVKRAMICLNFLWMKMLLIDEKDYQEAFGLEFQDLQLMKKMLLIEFMEILAVAALLLAISSVI